MILLANILLALYVAIVSVVPGSGRQVVTLRVMDHRVETASMIRLLLPGQTWSQSSAGLSSRDTASFDPKTFMASSGQKIPSAAGCANPYTAQRGDTLYTIAWRCGVTVANLKRWNGLKSTTVRTGQRVIVRSPAAPSKSVPSLPAPRPTPRIEPPIRP